jgi:Sporulation and spore germination.
MKFEQRVEQAADALRRSVASAPANPHRILVRYRRRRLVLASTLILMLFGIPVLVQRVAGRGEDTHVAARGSRPDTAIPTESPSSDPQADERTKNECRPPEDGNDDETTTTVLVYFFCGNEPPPSKPRPVPRQVPPTKAPVHKALEELLKGPTEEERQAGFFSVVLSFGPDVLAGVSIRDGTAFIDFSEALPKRNVGGGSAFTGAFFRQFDPTVFQFSEIDQIVYRIDGDADRFCDMFEITCEPVTRGEAAKQ